MMHLPRAIVVVLGIRQMAGVFPDSYCTPECPTCKADVAVFDTSISCVANSSFINNCGNCQTCVSTYNLLNGSSNTPQAIQIQKDIAMFLNYCENTTVSTIIQAYQSQANRVSSFAQAKATPTQLTFTNYSSPMPTATGSVGSVQTSLAPSASAGINATAMNTAAPITPAKTPNPPLSHTWVLGPVAGSVLGMSTVFIVIFFTRRKQRRDMIDTAAEEVPKPFHDTPDDPSTRASSAAGDDVAQLHAESMEAKELETREIYEMAAMEPVGNELVTPMTARPRIRIGGGSDDGEEEDEDQYAMRGPLPLSPLPALFAATELRDERMGRSESTRHQTYYHP